MRFRIKMVLLMVVVCFGVAFLLWFLNMLNQSMMEGVP